MTSHSESAASAAKEERKFIHDLASPLAAALFLVDSILESVQERKAIEPDEISQLAKVLEALKRMEKMLRERREVLIKNGESSARS